MQFLKDIFYLFYPNLCTNCENKLIQNEFVICTFCRHDIPMANFKNYRDNKISKIFYGRVRIEKANALFFFRKKGVTKNLIHNLKYKGNEDVGKFFGNWWAEILKVNNEFNDVDFIVPVPLHIKKLKSRGYNQVTKFGKILSNELNIPYNEKNLIRINTSKTQTFKERFERFKNIETKFTLKNYNTFKNKHVLLIDDVITTGATLEACAKEIQKSNGCKISILTMAYTE